MKRFYTLLSILLLLNIITACDDDSNNKNNNNNTNNINNTNNTNNTNNSNCGNGILDDGETCDGTFLDSNDCTTIDASFVGGILSCNSSCDGWITSQCSTGNEVCGDGNVEGIEVCDGTNLNSNDCTTIGMGFTGGTLSCKSTCDFNTELCTTEVIECGNGIVEGTERCDGSNLNNTTCESLGFIGGTLGCREDCQFDASQCQSPGCGDGNISGLEVCEGTNLAGNDCTTIGQGFVGGTLACNSFCQWDVSQCENCGNNTINSGETCDGTDFGGADCTTIGEGFVSGTLACNNTCDGYDTSNCNLPVCGDLTKNGTEMCDNDDLGLASCTSIGQGFVSGTLACNNTCDGYDTSNCNLPVCGDLTKNGTELCDATDVGTATCTSIGQGFISGTLACNGTCDGWDTANCNLPVCGDSSIDGTEICDSADLDGNTCTSIGMGFISGSLGCNNTCDGWDTSSCNLPVCGDNSIDGSEICDGVDLDGNTCTSIGMGFISGSLGCNNTCDGWDTSSCNLPACGDNSIDGAEVCDASDLDGQSCTSQGFGSGTLACSADCMSYNYSSCVDGCGNGIVEGVEDCDGTPVTGDTCITEGFTGGTLICDSCGYNYNQCTGGCGNNMIEGAEVCDGTDLATATCASLGHTGGVLSCDATCGGYDESGCTDDYAYDNTYTFNWVELNADASAIALTLGDDEQVGPYPIGFTFSLYSHDATEFYVSSNGFVHFEDGFVSLSNECPFSTSSSYNYLVALQWDDLDGNGSGDIYYKSFATCPVGTHGGNCLIVEYDSYLVHTGLVSAGTFEAIFFQNGSILLQYLDAGVNTGSASTTGIKGASGESLLYESCNTAATLSDSLAICITAPGSNGC